MSVNGYLICRFDWIDKYIFQLPALKVSFFHREFSNQHTMKGTRVLLLVYITTFATTIKCGKFFKHEPTDQFAPLVDHPSGTIKDEVQFTCEANVENPTYTWEARHEMRQVMRIRRHSTSDPGRGDRDFINSDGDFLPITPDNTRFHVSGGNLTITNPQDDDARSYRCVVHYKDGVVISNDAKLILQYILKFPIIGQGDVQASAGNATFLTCPYNAFAPRSQVTFFWLKDSHTIATNDELYISQFDGTLHFENPKIGDNGNYQCVIKGNWKIKGLFYEEKSSLIPFEVIKYGVCTEAPRVLKPPKKLTKVVKGEIAFIQCFVTGCQSPEILWEHNGNVVKHGKQVELVLKNATDAMEGTYTCTTRNKYGMDSASGELLIQYKPHITGEIASDLVEVSSNYSMKCCAIASPSPSYSWLKNGQELYNSDKITVSNREICSQLTLTSVSKSDEGIYQCFAFNELGSDYTAAHLTTGAAPVFLAKQNETMKAVINSGTKITCNVSGDPRPKVEWFKGTQQLTNTGIKYEISDVKLKIYDVTKSDEGRYSCKSSNPLGSAFGEFQLLVFEQTLIFSYPRNQSLISGKNFSLNCKEKHDPNLKVYWNWTHNSKVPSNRNHYKTDKGLLELVNVGMHHTGVYECCANTQVSGDCAKTYIDVTDPPDAPTNVKIVNTSSTTQYVEWNAPNSNGAPIISYTVEKKSSNDREWSKSCISNTTSCLVASLLPYNNYTYRVYAYNMAGKSDASAESSGHFTSVGAPIRAPSKISRGQGSDDELVVEWKGLVEKYFGDKDVKYRICAKRLTQKRPYPFNKETWKEKVETNSTHTKFKVEHSEVDVYYEVKVRVENSAGAGPFSDPVGIVVPGTPSACPWWKVLLIILVIIALVVVVVVIIYCKCRNKSKVDHGDSTANVQYKPAHQAYKGTDNNVISDDS